MWTGAIREARFIKKVKRRAQGQKLVHVILGFTLLEQVNITIQQRLVIEGKKVQVRWHLKRCMKCQGIGVNHMVVVCKLIHDVCARCAGMHQTDQCKVESMADFKWSNCHAKGHGAADRECPVFRAKLTELHAKILNHTYCFFSTKDPST